MRTKVSAPVAILAANTKGTAIKRHFVICFIGLSPLIADRIQTRFSTITIQLALIFTMLTPDGSVGKHRIVRASVKFAYVCPR
jgi:hypothetical protein